MSNVAATESFGSLLSKLALQILCESSTFMGIRVIQGFEGMVLRYGLIRSTYAAWTASFLFS